jgi:hypothetical protein
MGYETPWQFETARFRVELRIYPCENDPADSFDMPEDVEAVRNGDVAWFDAAVCVIDKETGARFGRDSLGCCAYRDAEEFYTSHRDRNPMNRNCSIMRAAHGSNMNICHYFPGMVAEAVKDVRNAAARLGGLHQ